MFYPILLTPRDRIRSQRNVRSRWLSERIIETRQVIIRLMQRSDVSTKRIDPRPAAANRDELIDKFLLAAARPRIDRRIRAKKNCQSLINRSAGGKKPSHFEAFKRMNFHPHRHEIAKFGSRENIHLGILPQNFERRQKAYEVAERAGEEHAYSHWASQQTSPHCIISLTLRS